MPKAPLRSLGAYLPMNFRRLPSNKSMSTFQWRRKRVDELRERERRRGERLHASGWKCWIWRQLKSKKKKTFSSTDRNYSLFPLVLLQKQAVIPPLLRPLRLLPVQLLMWAIIQLELPLLLLLLPITASTECLQGSAGSW